MVIERPSSWREHASFHADARRQWRPCMQRLGQLGPGYQQTAHGVSTASHPGALDARGPRVTQLEGCWHGSAGALHALLVVASLLHCESVAECTTVLRAAVPPIAGVGLASSDRALPCHLTGHCPVTSGSGVRRATIGGSYVLRPPLRGTAGFGRARASVTKETNKIEENSLVLRACRPLVLGLTPPLGLKP